MNNTATRLYLLSTIIVLAALSRLLPHPPNFAPITAIALFAGTQVSQRALAMLIPLAAMFISDVALEFTTGWGFHSEVWVVYLTFMLITSFGFYLRSHKSLKNITLITFTSSLTFFLITNFAIWALGSGAFYPHTPGGLIACYIAALPFFGNTILGDCFYSALLFGGFAYIERRFPVLQEAPHGFAAKEQYL